MFAPFPRANPEYSGVVPAFSYVARDGTGKRLSGRLESASESMALGELAARGLVPVRLEAVGERAVRRRRIGGRHLARLYRQLADLLRAGVPLLKALRLLGRGKSNPALAAVVAQVAEEIAQGERFADALARHPRVFPSSQVAMVRAGERGGFLEQVLGRIGLYLERQAEVRARIVGSLIYPAILIVFGSLVILGTMIFLVPRFRDFYKRIEVPLPTKMLLGASDLFTTYWPALAVVAVAAPIAVWWALRKPRVSLFVAAALLRIPTVGPLIKGVSTARFTRTLGTLLENGIPVLPAMQIARDAAGHPILVDAVDRAIEAVRAGDSLAPPLAASGFLEEDVIEMISVGESANNLAQVLLTIADTLEARADLLLGVFVQLLSPIMLLTIAGFIGFIFLALVVPMMKLSSLL
jgi:general secretion pathway protein F/type IV pilus assembly protein PilC